MATKISANLEKLTSQAQQQDLVSSASDQGFKSQEREIYIYEIRDFYGKGRAVFNELSNQIYLLTAHKELKKKAYILEEIKNNANFSLNANIIGNALEFTIKINILLDTENKTYFITFNKLEEDTKMENIFYPTNIINKNTNNPEVDYEYQISSIGTILGENSSIKVYQANNIGTIKKINTISIKPKEKWICGGFDSNLDLTLQNIFPLWTKISKADTNTFDYINMWSNKNWIYDWKELLKNSELNIANGKQKTTITRLLTDRNKPFEPGINLIKKLLQLNITMIRNFEGFDKAGAINIIGQVPGRFWQEKINQKGESEVNNVLANYIITEMRHWRNGQYQGPIEPNYPWGKIIPFPADSLEYSERMRQRVLSIIFMLSSQLISPYSLAGGRTDFTFFALPYFLTFNETQVRTNPEIGLYDLIGEELFIESAYITFSYPYFTEEQIKEFNETRSVHGYAVITTNKNATLEEKYGPINPYLEVGDEIIVKESINRTTHFFEADNFGARGLTTNTIIAVEREPLGFDNNPLILCLTDFPESIQFWDYLDLPKHNVIPIAIVYSYSKWSVWGSDEINDYKTIPLRVVSWYDFIKTPAIILGVLYNTGPQPKPSDYQNLVNCDKGEVASVSNVQRLGNIISFINDKIIEIENNDNKFFIGTPTIDFNIKGYHYILALGPLTTFEFHIESCTLKAVIATGNIEVYKKVAQRKNISLEELFKQIKKSSYPKLKELELENEGLKIDLIDQEMIIPSMNENITSEEYTTYPQAITGKNLTTTWLFLSTINKIPENFLNTLTTERQIPYNELVNQTYIFTNAEPDRLLTFFKLKGFFSSVAEMDISCNDNQKIIKLNIVLGNKTEENETTVTVVLKIREGEI